jgi:hypothetical protein
VARIAPSRLRTGTGDVDGIDVTKTGDWNSRLIKLAAVVHCYKALHGVLLAPHH